MAQKLSTHSYQFLKKSLYQFAFVSLMFFTNAYIADPEMATLFNAVLFGLSFITVQLVIRLVK